MGTFLSVLGTLLGMVLTVSSFKLADKAEAYVNELNRDDARELAQKVAKTIGVNQLRSQLLNNNQVDLTNTIERLKSTSKTMAQSKAHQLNIKDAEAKLAQVNDELSAIDKDNVVLNNTLGNLNGIGSYMSRTEQNNIVSDAKTALGDITLQED